MKKKSLVGYWFGYGNNFRNTFFWQEGNSGVEYMVLDSIFKNKRVLSDLLPHRINNIKKVRITIEEIEP